LNPSSVVEVNLASREATDEMIFSCKGHSSGSIVTPLQQFNSQNALQLNREVTGC
jgi:hypothetical protein